MDISKNKSSHPIQFVVRASEKTNRKHFTKKKNRDKRKFRRDLLLVPEDYYPKELKRFTRGKSQGRALCPFHDDCNPSFTVNLKTGAFICFACGVSGGDILSFHIKRYDLSFVDACKALGVWYE
jgi:hypothetical protein